MDFRIAGVWVTSKIIPRLIFIDFIVINNKI